MINEFLRVTRVGDHALPASERQYRIIGKDEETTKQLRLQGVGPISYITGYANAVKIANTVTELRLGQQVSQLDYDVNPFEEEKEPVSKLRNLAAFVSDELVTVGAQYNGRGKEYTFLAAKLFAEELHVEDKVIVYTQGEFKVVQITRVDDEVNIDIDAGFNCQPIYGKLNPDHFNEVNEYLDKGEADLKKQQRAALRAQIKGNLDTVLLESSSDSDF